MFRLAFKFPTCVVVIAKLLNFVGPASISLHEFIDGIEAEVSFDLKLITVGLEAYK